MLRSDWLETCNRKHQTANHHPCVPSISRVARPLLIDLNDGYTTVSVHPSRSRRSCKNSYRSFGNILLPRSILSLDEPSTSKRRPWSLKDSHHSLYHLLFFTQSILRVHMMDPGDYATNVLINVYSSLMYLLHSAN